MPVRFHKLDGEDFVEVRSPRDPDDRGTRRVLAQDKRFWPDEWAAYRDSLEAEAETKEPIDG